MKNPERVAELLAELYSLAENDFEHHRLNVLERDLTAPPKIEVVSDNIQLFNGRKYYQHSSGRFRTNDTIHRSVYEYCVGEIPEGYEIHHIDGNTANNSLNNLQCLSASEHGALHRTSSPAQEHTCLNCGKKFFSRKLGEVKYCSKSCRRAGRRLSGVDDVEKICPVCGKTFISNRYDETFTCSVSCGKIFRKSHEEKITRACLYCGKNFETPKNNPANCCSRLCRHRYYRQTNKEERTCIVCGKTFMANRDGDAKTCSHKCRAKVIWDTRKLRGH